eukprot:tig00020528_g9983.t1
MIPAAAFVPPPLPAQLGARWKSTTRALGNRSESANQLKIGVNGPQKRPEQQRRWRALPAAGVQVVASAAGGHSPRSEAAATPDFAPVGRRAALLSAAAAAALQLAAPFAPARAAAAPLEEDYTATPSGLRFVSFAEGNGEAPAEGQVVEIKYAAYFLNYEGKFIDKVAGDQEPFSFRVGSGDVIPGLDEAVRGMRPGAIRRLVIPAELGYKSPEDGPKPRSFGGRRLVDYVLRNPRVDASVLMDVELVRVRRG